MPNAQSMDYLNASLAIGKGIAVTDADVERDTLLSSSSLTWSTYNTTAEDYVSINTSEYGVYEAKEYIFDRLEVKIIFITLYTMVFGCCFFGELNFLHK